METPKEAFSGKKLSKNPGRHGRGEGIEQMLRDEVALQVTNLLKTV